MRSFVLPVYEAVLLIIIGAVIWLSNLGLLHILWRRDWPMIIVLIGLFQLLKCLIRRR
jgi:hypothetical protein